METGNMQEHLPPDLVCSLHDLQRALAGEGDVLTLALRLQGHLREWEQRAAAQISSELQEAIRPLLAVVAKAKAIGGQQLDEFLQVAFVPDPTTIVQLESERLDGANLLHVQARDTEADAIAVQVGEVRSALMAAAMRLGGPPSNDLVTEGGVTGKTE